MKHIRQTALCLTNDTLQCYVFRSPTIPRDNHRRGNSFETTKTDQFHKFLHFSLGPIQLPDDDDLVVEVVACRKDNDYQIIIYYRSYKVFG